ncbi:glutamate--cysteine ligase [Cupriavidus consociatus]|uniref:glutamate--cysteine ligase n=1 Tax=Cupriavidus consociatus TaxID=2821357 RepID=UPI001AEB1EAC|nr:MULTISPECIES: glutamate--cysteine ligase [unclassified Cupriavidus]MBP0621182.1 glutamate--cysteine ligase [Cupriavidus sp. LEh25]MDK2657853.1 glutamate--cysteine ligase [Cupriavidus sp. LEh21]
MIPHPCITPSGPLSDIEKKILASQHEIERWFCQEWIEHTPPIYSSVDLRNAGFKLSPVDTNLFPGGWNNLTPPMVSLAARVAAATLTKACPSARRLLVVPENHTRNLFYLRNIAQLQQVLSLAGFDVRVGTVNPEITHPTSLEVSEGQRVTLEPVVRTQSRLGLANFDPCVVLINNDLSGGVPAILEGLHGQCLLPQLSAGWYRRRKSRHFSAYEQVASRFGKVLGLDPWLFNPLYMQCEVNFAEGTGTDHLQVVVEELLASIRRKYREHGVTDAPFVVVKADNGTYGMGIMTVRDAKELEKLNRRTRNKMAVVKDGQRVSSVLVQEGVPTLESIHGATAEPVAYMIGSEVVGGFYRANAGRGRDENLNAPGANFVPVAFEAMSHQSLRGATGRFYAYGVIARLAALAASSELEYTDRDSQAILDVA